MAKFVNHRAEFEAALRKTWNEARYTIAADQLNDDNFRYWWDTLIQTEPNYDEIMDNTVSLNIAPLQALISLYYYGYSKALTDMAEENIILVNSDNKGKSRVPEWLEKDWLEGLYEKYGDKH